MPEDAKVHVGNLAFDTKEGDLEREFERYGRIEQVQIIKDRDTGRAKGYGFVMFENIEDAKDAIHGEDQREFLGRVIKCEKARPRRSDGGGGGGYRAPRDSFNRRDFDRGFRDDRRGGRRDDDFRRRDDFRPDERRDNFRRDNFRRDDRPFRGRRGGSRDRDRPRF